MMQCGDGFRTASIFFRTGADAVHQFQHSFIFSPDGGEKALLCRRHFVSDGFPEPFFRGDGPVQQSGKPQRKDRIPIRNAVAVVEKKCNQIGKFPPRGNRFSEGAVEHLFGPDLSDRIGEQFVSPDAESHEEVVPRYADPHVVKLICKSLRFYDRMGTLLFPFRNLQQSGFQFFEGKSGFRDSRILKIRFQLRLIPIESQHFYAPPVPGKNDIRLCPDIAVIS